jgi:hypothetical protein
LGRRLGGSLRCGGAADACSSRLPQMRWCTCRRVVVRRCLLPMAAAEEGTAHRGRLRCGWLERYWPRHRDHRRSDYFRFANRPPSCVTSLVLSSDTRCGALEWASAKVRSHGPARKSRWVGSNWKPHIDVFGLCWPLTPSVRGRLPIALTPLPAARVRWARPWLPNNQ